MTTSDPGPPATTLGLPNEMWKVVISYLENDDLKNTRIVNSVFKDFATPILFHHVCLSLTPENMDNIMELSKSEELCQHVKVLYLDLTTYVANMTPSQYAEWMSTYFGTYSGSLPTQDTGPLSSPKLLKVLESNPARELGEDYLSGPPRAAFIAGYAQALARVACFTELTKNNMLYAVFKRLFSVMMNIHSVASISAWDFADQHSTQLSHYLRRYLPEKTFKQIPGLHNASALNQHVDEIGGWRTPGPSARRSHLLCPSPIACKDFKLAAEYEITVAALRALHDSPHIHLKTLCLPGPDSISGNRPFLANAAKRDGRPVPTMQRAGAMSKIGFVSLLSLISAPIEREVRQQNFLLPVFKKLRTLELQIDYAHPGPNSIMSRFQSDLYRLPRALQAMDLVTKMSIGYCKPIELPSMFETPPPVPLYDTMLYREDDFEDEDEDDDDIDTPPNGVSRKTVSSTTIHTD